MSDEKKSTTKADSNNNESSASGGGKSIMSIILGIIGILILISLGFFLFYHFYGDKTEGEAPVKESESNPSLLNHNSDNLSSNEALNSSKLNFASFDESYDGFKNFVADPKNSPSDTPPKIKDAAKTDPKDKYAAAKSKGKDATKPDETKDKDAAKSKGKDAVKGDDKTKDETKDKDADKPSKTPTASELRSKGQKGVSKSSLFDINSIDDSINTFDRNALLARMEMEAKGL